MQHLIKRKKILKLVNWEVSICLSWEMSLRPGAVNFEEKWRGLESTISAVVTLSPVSHATWNDQYSYPTSQLMPLPLSCSPLSQLV